MIYTGKVTDEFGQGMPDVHVATGNRGAITDINGRFSVDLDKNDTVVFSHVGYTPRRFVARELPKTIQLYPGGQLPEVVLKAPKRTDIIIKTLLGAGALVCVIWLLMPDRNQKNINGLNGYTKVII